MMMVCDLYLSISLSIYLFHCTRFRFVFLFTRHFLLAPYPYFRLVVVIRVPQKGGKTPEAYPTERSRVFFSLFLGF